MTSPLVKNNATFTTLYLCPAMKPILFLISLLISSNLLSQKVDSIPVALGWAKNSVNTVVFRKNSLTTWKQTQFIAFYDEEQFLVIGKRQLNSAKWIFQKSPYKGNAGDAHNSISIMADGKGFLHVAWNHHNTPLQYCKSISPGSIVLGEKMAMTGQFEASVTYPEFYKMPSGDLMFLYRDGESGKGNLIINSYNVRSEKWSQIQSLLIDGEGQRNAYWQAAVDDNGYFHLSWVWRESADVASNHDLCYAFSRDGGLSWEKSTGEKYNLPITAATAEYACVIPQKSELINQTSMYVLEGIPIIASYWRGAATIIPQYHIVYLENGKWKQQIPFLRKTPFSLSGTGTKQIPISRPQVVAWKKDMKYNVALLFRDEERGNKVSVSINKNFPDSGWTNMDLNAASVGSWEPTYDTELWKSVKQLSLFVQNVIQIDGEGKSSALPQMIYLLLVTLG